MIDRAELRQKVAAAFHAVWSADSDGTLRRDQAWDAAIDVVLEEAARDLDCWGGACGDYAAYAIRAMKGK